MNKFNLKTIWLNLKIKTSPISSCIVLIIAIISTNAWQLTLPNFSSDNSFSIAAAKNIYDGKGYSLTSLSQKDLSKISYEPLNKWPPGYSWILVLIKKTTKANWIISCYILNALGATMLILALFKIMLLLKIPTCIKNVYLLYSGFIPYPFLSVWFSDLLAVAFFMWGLTCLLYMIVKNKNLNLYSIISGLLLGFCAWLKYLYLPISFVPLIFLLLYAFKVKNLKLVKALSLGGIFLITSVAGLLWFQHLHSGSSVYINPTGNGFFPESWLHFAPLIPASMIDFKLYNFYLSAILHIPYPKMIFFWNWLDAALMLATLLVIIRFFHKNGFQIKQPLNIYMCLGLAVSTSISLLLAGLSITEAPYVSRFTAYWTYVEELRYYGVVLIFIPQGILFLLLYQRNLLSWAKKPFIVIVTIAVLIQVVHGFYYLSQQMLIKKEIGTARKSEELDLLVLKTAQQLIKTGDNLIVCSNSNEIENIASLSGIPCWYNGDSLNVKFHSSKPITLFIILNDKAFPEYKDFFLFYHPYFLLRYCDSDVENQGTNFYLLKLP